MSGQPQGGPPYIPHTAGVGGRPTIKDDIPGLAVLLLFYIGGAVGNMTIFQLNRRKGHKYIPSVAMFGFCMSRIATCILRMAWATHPTNISLAIASQIFVNVGVLIIYIVVLLLSIRMFRATHPQIGWNKALGISMKALYFLLFCAIVLVISFTILSFYTLNMTIRNDAKWIQRAAILYMLLFNVISAVLYLASALLPRARNAENFGSDGRGMGTKFIVLGVALFFSLFISGFRAGYTWATPRPATDPAWYDSKPAFYVILFVFEIFVVYLFILTRFDRLFWIPNGSHQPGDFAAFHEPTGKSEGRVSAETTETV